MDFKRLLLLEKANVKMKYFYYLSEIISLAGALVYNAGNLPGY